MTEYELASVGQDVYSGFGQMQEIMILSLMLGGLSELMRQQGHFLQLPMLIDQGLADDFYQNQKLAKPLESIAQEMNYPAEFRYHKGYDHSYYFISTFIEDHLRFHAKHLAEY